MTEPRTPTYCSHMLAKLSRDGYGKRTADEIAYWTKELLKCSEKLGIPTIYTTH